jgi:hypothetical protein
MAAAAPLPRSGVEVSNQEVGVRRVGETSRDRGIDPRLHAEKPSGVRRQWLASRSSTSLVSSVASASVRAMRTVGTSGVAAAPRRRSHDLLLPERHLAAAVAALLLGVWSSKWTPPRLPR